MQKKWLTFFMCALFAAPLCAQIKVGTLDFKRCEIGMGMARAKAGCAYFEVPENYAASAIEGKAPKSINLHVALLASRAKKPMPDPVVFFAGGPGQAGSESVASIRHAFEQILKDRHVIVLDQRGTGRSLKLACPADDSNLNELDLQDETKVASLLRAAAESCRKQLEALPEKPDLAQYTTGNAVEDIERLRIALDAKSLNLVGISYGTRLALQFAKRYPSSTRSLILDGLVPNDLALGAEHAKVLDSALSKILNRCNADKACNARFGDSAANLRALRDAWEAPSKTTIVDPRTGKPTDAWLGSSSLQAVARMYAYSSEYASMLPLLLHEAREGRPQALLAQTQMVSEDLGEAMSYGMQLSIICAEDADRFIADPLDKDRLLGSQFSLVFSQQCPVWPKGQRAADFAEPLRGALPTLLISGEFDPVTPPEYGERVLKTLSNAVHITVAKHGHVNMGRGCVPKLSRDFLEALEPKKLSLECVKKILPSPFFLDYTGAAP